MWELPCGLYRFENICFIPNCAGTVFIRQFFIQSHCLKDKPWMHLSLKGSLKDKLLLPIPAALLGIGTAIMYDVKQAIKVSMYLLPEEVVGNPPMVSIAIHAKGTLGTFKCSWGDMQCSVNF